LLAAQLALQVEDLSPLERVKEYLHDRQLLLVLDNFEHVVSAAMTVAELLESCPQLKVLATSREPLRLRWEQRMPVSELAIPDPAGLPPAEELGAIPQEVLELLAAGCSSKETGCCYLWSSYAPTSTVPGWPSASFS
jgi:predicted ATPase